jgi:hypothetical protein
MSYLFDEEKQNLFVADFWDLVAYNRFCEVTWHRKALGVDGIQLVKIHEGIIEGKLCWDPPDNWIKFKISSETGEDV